MDPVLTDLFVNVAGGLITYVVEKLDSAESLKAWLKRDPASLAFQKALARAYAAFARQYPEYTSSLFDQSFLSTDALPEISKFLTRDQHPDPALLVQVWGRSLGANADFAQTATKPAAYFLERFEAELKAETVLQSLFDSRALESLPKLEAEIQKLTTDLQRGLDEALKAAQNYQQATIHIGGDVIGDGIIIGNNNQLTVNKYYYSGDFVSLNEYYIPPDGVFQRVRVDEFVGRDWLTAKVDAFLNDPNQKSGAFLLVGDAGVGKTAFMAHLVKERRYLHLFAEQVPGQAMLQRALQSLGSQLVTRYQIDPYKDRDTLNVLAGFPDFLERLLRLAASTLTEGEKIVIVCDALDEAGVFPDHFVFGLPKELPDGVYLILSQRPVNTKLPNFEPLRFDLEAQGEDNLQDMEAYLSAVAKRPAVAGQIRAKDYAEDFFVKTLKEKSLGVWMYLHYVIKEIERGQRAPLDLESLPKGLVGYYADYWDNWRSGRKGSDATKWDNLYAPLLATLAAAQEAITVEKLIEWAGVQTSPNEVTRLLSELWGSFITEKEEKGRTVYTLYHQSLRDFITGKVEDIKKLQPTYASLVSDLSKKKVEAHQRIVNAFEAECSGKWEILVEQDYSRLHLSAHMNGAVEYEKLRILLTEGDKKIKWAEAREKKEETYAGYLSDLNYVWDYAKREQNYVLIVRCMLIQSSIHSLASNTPPRLIAELAKTELWSYERCFSVIAQKPEPIEQIECLKLLTSGVSNSLNQEVLRIVNSMQHEMYRAEALRILAPYLNREAIKQAFSMAYETKNISYFSNILANLFGYLPNTLRAQAFDDILKIKDLPSRYHALAIVVPYLNEEIKIEIISEILLAVDEIEDKFKKSSILMSLIPHLIGDLKTQAINNLLSYAQCNKHFYVISLANVIPHLSTKDKTELIKEMIDVAHKTNDNEYKSSILRSLAPYIPDNMLDQSISIARTLQNLSRPSTLIGFLPYLEEDKKAEVSQECIQCMNEMDFELTKSTLIEDLATYLSESLSKQVFSVVRKFNKMPNRAKALARLASNMTGDLTSKKEVLQEALTVSRNIGDEFTQADTIEALIPFLTENSKRQIYLTALKIEERDARIYSITSILKYLPDEVKIKTIEDALVYPFEFGKENRLFLLKSLAKLAESLSKDQQKKALQFSLQTKDESRRVESLAILLPYLSENEKKQAIQEAISAAYRIKNEKEKSGTLAFLARYLHEEQKTKVLQEVLNTIHIHDENFRDLLLQDIISHLPAHLNLPDHLKMRIVSIILEFKDTNIQVRNLINAVSIFTGEAKKRLIDMSLNATLKIANKDIRHSTLAKLAPYLDENIKKQLLDSIYKSNNEYNYNRGDLLKLSPFLDKEMRIAIFQDILLSQNYFGISLSSLLKQWRDIDYKGIGDYFFLMFVTVAKKKRDETMKHLTDIIPTLFHFSGANIADELYRAIQDVTRWWP
jgi:hypothetical protein